MLSLEEAKKLLETSREDGFHTLYGSAITCRPRQGELLGLKWSDVDLAKGTLRIRRQLQRMRDGSVLAFLPTKNPKGRPVRLGPSATEVLASHWERQAAEKLALGVAYEDTGQVFPTTIGTPVDAQNVVHRSFEPLLKLTGLPNVRSHD